MPSTFPLDEGEAAAGIRNGAAAIRASGVEVERRASRIKKKLEIDPVEAETVRLMFGCSSKATPVPARWVSRRLPCGSMSRGYRTRGGATGVSDRSTAMLSQSGVCGPHAIQFGWRRGPAGEERIGARVCRCAAIFEPKCSSTPRRLLQGAQPTDHGTAGWLQGPVLLTGLAVCADCR